MGMLKLDLPNEDYHKSSGISKSQLDIFRRSAYHYWSVFIDPRAPERKETDAMRQGTIIHAAVLEPERFEAEYKVAPCKDKRTKKWKDFMLECGDGFSPITQAEYERAMRCHEAVRNHAWANAALSDGQAEVSAFAEEPEAGNLEVRSRFDWITTSGALVDLKTSLDASPWGFRKSVRTFKYDLQAAMYKRVAELNHIADACFLFVVVEREFPFGVGVYQLSADAMAKGLANYHDLTSRFQECLRTDVWPGYTKTLETLEL